MRPRVWNELPRNAIAEASARASHVNRYVHHFTPQLFRNDARVVVREFDVSVAHEVARLSHHSAELLWCSSRFLEWLELRLLAVRKRGQA